MSVSSVSSTRAMMSSTTTPTGIMGLIQDLQSATQSCNWQRASQKAQELVTSGRIVILQSIQQNHSFNPLPMTEILLATLSSSQLQWEDDVKYHLAKATRIFLELSCMKAVSEKRDLYRTTQETLRTQLDTLLNYARPEEVALRYELKCSSEALKLMEKTDYKEYLLAMFEAAKDPSIGSAISLLSLIPSLLKKKSQGWFSDALFISWFTVPARTSPKLYAEIVGSLKDSLTTLETVQASIEFFADIIWSGIPELQQKALQESPGLITLLNQKRPPKNLFNLLSTMWPVRYRTVQILSTLTSHPNPIFKTLAANALLQRRLQESRPEVKKLLETLEKNPALSSQWKTQFEAQKALAIQQNLQDEEEILQEETRVKDLEDKLKQATASNRYTQEQIRSLQQKIQEEKAYVGQLRAENQAHKDNVEELHVVFKKGVNNLLDEVFANQPKASTTPPPHFCCPITQDLMTDPTLAADGNSYERSAIETWLATHDTSPLTGARLSTKSLFPNRSLKDAIEKFMDDAGLPHPQTPSSRPTSSASSSSSSQSSDKAAYKKLLIQLSDNNQVRENSALIGILEKLFDELELHESAQLDSQQNRIYALMQELYIDQKVSTFVAKKLIQMCTPSQQPSPASPPLLQQRRLPQLPVKTAVAPVVIQVSKPSLPSIAFGAAMWNRYFGDVGAEPPLPSNIQAILSAPCPFFPGKTVQETHLLTLIPKTVNDIPLTLNSLGEFVQKPKQGSQGTAARYSYYWDAIKSQYGNTKIETSYWILFTRDVIPGSRNKSYDDQKKLVETLSRKANVSYQVPLLLEAATSIFMQYVQTGTPLYGVDPWTYTRCQEMVSSHPSWPLTVGGFAPAEPAAGGLYVDHSIGDVRENYGVGGSRKFMAIGT